MSMAHTQSGATDWSGLHDGGACGQCDDIRNLRNAIARLAHYWAAGNYSRDHARDLRERAVEMLRRRCWSTEQRAAIESCRLTASGIAHCRAAPSYCEWSEDRVAVSGGLPTLGGRR